MRKSVQQRLRLQKTAAAFGIKRDGIGPRRNGRFIAPNQKFSSDLRRHTIPELDHLAKFETSIDMQKRKRNGRRIKSLLRETQHN